MKAKFIYEAIKHLRGREKDEIKQAISTWGPYDKFFSSIKENFPEILDEFIKSVEFKEYITTNDLKIGLNNACMYGHPEIVRILLDNGANIKDVKYLNILPSQIVPIIQEYRKIKQKNVRK